MGTCWSLHALPLIYDRPHIINTILLATGPLDEYRACRSFESGISDGATQSGSSNDLSRRNGFSDVYANITGMSSWSLTDFEDAVCAAVGANTLDVLVDCSAGVSPFKMPDCFYNNAGTVKSFQLRNIKQVGSAAEADPLLRLFVAVSSSSLDLVFVYGCVLEYDSKVSGSYNVAWSSLFNAISSTSLTSFVWSGTNLGSGMAGLPVFPTNFRSLSLLSLDRCGLVGNIPSGSLDAFDGAYTTRMFNFSGNQLTGSIPSDLFAAWPAAQLALFSVSFASNQLSGSISDLLFDGSYASCIQWAFDVRNNSLSGPVQYLLSSTSLSYGKLLQFTLQLDNNQFIDTPFIGLTSLFSSSASVFTYTASHNAFTGTLPSNFLSNIGIKTDLSNPDSTFRLWLDLSHNSLSGPLNAGFFNLRTTTAPASSPDMWKVNLSDNQLSGEFPSTIFEPIDFTYVRQMEFYFGGNLLSGDAPYTIFGANTTVQLSSMIISFENNINMAGSVPESFLASLSQSNGGSNPTVSTISFANSSLTGALSVPDLRLRTPAIKLSILAANANFTSFPFDDSGCGVLTDVDFTASVLVDCSKVFRFCIHSSIFQG